jgi:hypothetical protein
MPAAAPARSPEPLLSINDPFLTKPVLTTKAPPAPLMSIDDLDKPIEYDFKNPAAKHMATHDGFFQHALHLENCYKYMNIELCEGKSSPRGDKHASFIHITCQQRYCKYCGPARVRDAIARWYANHPYLRKRKDFLYFEISRDFECLPDSEELKWFNGEILTFADIAEKGRIAGTGAIWNTVIRRLPDGNDGNPKYRFVAKFIWYGDYDDYVGYECWWETMSNINMSVVPICSFDTALREMFNQEMPEDPIDAANFETMVSGQRTIHSAGGFVRAKNDTPEQPENNEFTDISEELFPTAEVLGNYSSNLAPNEPKPPRTCHVCGDRMAWRSDCVPADTTEDQFPTLNWYPIPHPSPPPG